METAEVYYSSTIIEASQARESLLANAEREILEKLCGAMANVAVMARLRMKRLAAAAGVDATGIGEESNLDERNAAIMVMVTLHKTLGHYPAAWDDTALGANHKFDSEQLTYDLRKRVRRAIAVAWLDEGVIQES